MSRTSRVFSVFISMLWLLASGCSGGDDEAGAAPPLPANCSGQYDCRMSLDLDPVDLATGRLALEKGACVWRDSAGEGGIDLSRPEVTIDGRDFHVRLTVDSRVISIDCAPVGSGSSSTGSDSARCIGSAQSCSSVPLSECSVQDGCHYSVKSAYSTSDDSCDGSADECDEYTSRSACERQRGCSWQP